MTLFLDRVDAVPVSNSEFSMQFSQWLSVLVDTLNEDLSDLQGAVMSRTSVTGTTQAVEINSSYTTHNAAQTVFTLPNTAAEGSRLSIIGEGSGGWKLNTAGFSVHVAGTPAPASIASSSRYDCISLECVVANTTWVVVNSQTAGFVIL